MALWPESVVYAWTGDRLIAISASPVLPFYAMGNVFLAILSPVYYLQIARGYLRLHVMGHIFFALVLIPLVYWATLTYGAAGASQAWFAINLLFLLVWSPLVLHRLLPGESRPWYVNSLLVPSVAAVALALAAKFFLPQDWTRGRWVALVDCAIAWAIVSVASILAAQRVRDKALAVFRR
jgi:O-antigen/teichoic acid export membrane protein